MATVNESLFLQKLLTSPRNISGFYVGATPFAVRQSRHIFALYNRFLFQWVDGRIAFSVNLINHAQRFFAFNFLNCCQIKLTKLYRDLRSSGRLMFKVHCYPCDKREDFDILCEREKPNSRSKIQNKLRSRTNLMRWNENFVQCTGGHVTRIALSCNIESDCGLKDMPHGCLTGRDAKPVPMFLCLNSKQSTHYSLVCDHIPHCSDKSDENFCHFPSCPLMFSCKSGQCIAPEKECDDVVDCLDATDENCLKWFDGAGALDRQDVPSVVQMVGSGFHVFTPMQNTSDCPVTHFLCPYSDCLPVFLRCNDIVDCVGREDEVECEDYTCPGFYRCLGSKVCLHPDHLCDDYWQCPLHDDEMLCDPRCPDACQCQGLAFVCSRRFNTSSYPDLRLLDASGSDMTLSDIAGNPFLIHLNLSRCNIDSMVEHVLDFPNLRILDLSWNKIFHVDVQSLAKLDNLLVLILSNNPLSAMSDGNAHLKAKLSVRSIYLSNTNLQVYNSTAFAVFASLQHLKISSSSLTTITSLGFQTTPVLETLDARFSPLSVFPTDLIRNLRFLKSVHVDNYKICCPVMLPVNLPEGNCHTVYDLVSSCEDLLRSDVYRIFLWGSAFFAVVGNVCSFVSRFYLHIHGSSSKLSGFGVFVANLCLADCLMGIYLVIVGANDAMYLGQYLFYDDKWKRSLTCKIAGILSVLSSEVSAFMISLITLDRLLVIRFPFSQVRVNGRSAAVVCGITWTVGLLLATLPALPVTSHWEFFSQTGICLPLPFVSSDSFKGYTYSFAIMVVLNFILFVLIACGQVVIYWSVQASSLDSTNKDSRARDATLARRLITVALSDFLCWFPVGLLGVMGFAGTAISDEVSVAVAIFVVPLNSALNPFLYTLNVVKEKQKESKERRLIKQLQTRMAVSQIRTWLQKKVLLEEDIQPLI